MMYMIYEHRFYEWGIQGGCWPPCRQLGVFVSVRPFAALRSMCNRVVVEAEAEGARRFRCDLQLVLKGAKLKLILFP